MEKSMILLEIINPNKANYLQMKVQFGLVIIIILQVAKLEKNQFQIFH